MGELVAIQGLEGSYTSWAAREMHPDAELMYCKTFREVFENVRLGNVSRGVVAFYNTRIDAIHEPYTEFTDHDKANTYWIAGGITLPVEHCVAMNPGGSMETLRYIHTQEEAIQQCDQLMYELNGSVEFRPEKDTALSAQIVAESGRTDSGAICSERAAALHGLTVVRHSVQDDTINQTRFVSFVGKDRAYSPLDSDNTICALTLPQKPGSLSLALDILRDYEVDLRTIKSRTIPNTPMQVDIITEMRIGLHDERFIPIIRKLLQNNVAPSVIGSYKETISPIIPEAQSTDVPAVDIEAELAEIIALQERTRTQ